MILLFVSREVGAKFATSTCVEDTQLKDDWFEITFVTLTKGVTLLLSSLRSFHRVP